MRPAFRFAESCREMFLWSSEMDAQELIERVMTEHWDIGACPCFFCVIGRDLGFRPRPSYPTNPKVSILDDGSKEQRKPEYKL